jgi:hypothetical protein
MKSTSVAIAVAIATLVVAAAAEGRQDRRSAAPPRLRPPEGFACAANDLTAYTGVVTRYQREPERTTLRIRTDWETTEDVAVPHHGAVDSAASFRYAGRPFTAVDWPRIELRPGVLRPSMRATAWVCKDGQVMIDWEAPAAYR